MADETYYSVLNVKETASPAEIKTAYHDLIKQVHDDKITNLAPYLRQIAGEKAKEINEAYAVLSNAGKRREYDRQLAEYRRQNAPPAPQAPPPPSQQTAYATSSGPYCNRCGTSLYVSGFCPKCNKFGVPTTTPPQRKAVRWLGYNWAPLMRWAREHPILALGVPAFFVFVIASMLSNDTSPQDASKCLPSQRVEVNGGFVCKPPVQPTQAASDATSVIPATTYTVVSEESAPTKHPIAVVGVYTGNVHNQTVSLSSTFTVVIEQAKNGILGGCMEVKPPLYGSGVLHGSIRGSHINFVVADITFQGDASKTGITGSYVVGRQEGNQLGDFSLTKQTGDKTFYSCVDGAVAELEVVDATPRSQPFSDVPSGAQVLPPATNSTVENLTAPSTVSKPPAETRAPLSKQPDLSGLTSSERQSIEAACSHAKYSQGPAAYDQCLARQLEAWTAGPREPDLSALTSSERQSIQAACSHAKYSEGPAAFDRCLIGQFEAWAAGPKEPDLSWLTSSERQSIQAACSHAKYSEGPLPYDRCLIRQLQALSNYRR